MQRNKAYNWNIFVSPDSGNNLQGSGLNQLQRLTNFEYSWSKEKDQIEVLGQFGLKNITKDVMAQFAPISYYAFDFENELNLGFNTLGVRSSVSYLITDEKDDKDYFAFKAIDGDAFGVGGADGRVVGLGNGKITSFSFGASVTDYANSSVQVEGKNLRTYEDGVFQTPPSTSGSGFFIIPTGELTSRPIVLKRDNIVLDLEYTKSAFHGLRNFCPKSVSISFDIQREKRKCLGSRFVKRRKVTPPIDVEFSIEVEDGDIERFDLADLLCDTGICDAAIRLKKWGCENTDEDFLGKFELRGLSIDSEKTEVSSQENTTSTFIWKGVINNPNDTNNGIYFKSPYHQPQIDINPDTALGLVAWYEVGSLSGLAPGNSVSSWEDWSQTNGHLVQPSGSAQPTYQIDPNYGVPYVKFDGINDYLRTDDPLWASIRNLTNDPEFTIIVTYRKQEENKGSVLSWGNLAGIGESGNTAGLGFNNGWMETRTPFSNEFYVKTIRKEAGVINESTISLRDGMKDIISGDSSIPNIGDGNLEIGKWGSHNGAIDVIRVLIYNRALSYAETIIISEWAAQLRPLNQGDLIILWSDGTEMAWFDEELVEWPGWWQTP